MGEGVLSGPTLGPSVPTEHRLNAAADPSIAADHVHPFLTTVDPSADGSFEQDGAPCHQALITSNWVLEHDNEVPVLQRSPRSPDLNPTEQL